VRFHYDDRLFCGDSTGNEKREKATCDF